MYGWKLLEKESKGVEYSYKAQCPCGNITRKAPRTFPSRVKCKTCSNREKAEELKLTIEEAADLYDSRGIALLEKNLQE